MAQKTKNIWYISQYAAPECYGMGTRHFYFGREFNKAGHNCWVIASNQNHTARDLPFVKGRFLTEKVEGVDVCWVKGIEYRHPQNIRRLLGWLFFCWQLLFLPMEKLSRPDVIIVSSLSPLPILNAFWFRFNYGCKVIFEVRDIWPLVLTTMHQFKSWHPVVVVLGIIEKLAYRYSDGIVGTMPRLDLHIKSRIKRAFEFIYIPHASIEDEGALTKKQPTPGSTLTVGYAGAMGETNELKTLLEAADLLKEHAVQFLLIGEGILKHKWQQMAQDNPKVRFLPWVSKKELPAYLATCDLLYDGLAESPLYRFGTSRNKWIDYLKAGKPVILTYNGYENLVTKAGCGWVVKPGEAEKLASKILEFDRLPIEKRKEVGEKGKQFLKTHRSAKGLAHQYLEFMGLNSISEKVNV